MVSKLSFTSLATLMTLCITLSKAEVVNLSGSIKDQFNKPVNGADVKLLSNASIGTKTGTDGLFKISGQITYVCNSYITKLTPSAILRGSNIQVVLRKSSEISITVYDIAGKKLYDFSTGLLNAGSNVVALPIRKFGAGVYMITVNYGEDRDVLKYLSPTQGTADNTDSHSTSKGKHQAALKKSFLEAQAAIDTLLVSAEGYSSLRCPIASYNQSGIVIILEKTAFSRLDYITKDCDAGIKPSPVSGGKSGWGSRYWDCCKPHCSWPDKTKHYAANCNIDGVTQVPCFKEVHSGDWTGLQGTKSGCDQDGEAFMCYSHVPFAICKDLAMGFAAVPATGDVCGKCFQLDFDGGFKHGEAKPAHLLMKGKTMIVMASNVGGDVGGGQFDLMIPGGGLGIFKNGCAKQWKVDVNKESLVGKTYGGFTSTCQEKLGWDAEPEEVKICVRTMCDNLFGGDPALKDLHEGCIWYVEWMNAVDNPTFSYKEIECPQQLIDLYYSAYHPKP